MSTQTGSQDRGEKERESGSQSESRDADGFIKRDKTKERIRSGHVITAGNTNNNKNNKPQISRQ